MSALEAFSDSSRTFPEVRVLPEAAVSRCSIVCTESPWFVSSLMMDRALDAIVHPKTLDRKHDIPYLAGYSKDGKTIYIDRHMPSSFRYDGRDINTDRYLILHEEVEKTLIDQLNLRSEEHTS